LGYPSEFDPAPLGASLYAHYRLHVENGDAARMVLYQYDFAGCSAGLNLHGHDRLVRIGALSSHNDFPIIIERTPWDPSIAEARRTAVIKELARGPFPVPPQRVVIGPAIATGLAGQEAMIIYLNQLDNLLQKGGQASSGFTGTASVIGQSGVGAGAAGGPTATPPLRNP
jgi:hypothetical protein